MLTARSSRHPRRGAADTPGNRDTEVRPLRKNAAPRASAAPSAPPITLAGRHIHFVGIGGAALSGLAQIALTAGATVSGSDLQPSAQTERLQRAGVTVYQGHAAAHVGDADLVVISSAVPDTNPEVVAAQQQGRTVLKRHDFVGQLMRGQAGVGIAGAHGKTTTTSLLAVILTDAGLDPSILVGGEVRDLGLSARHGAGPHFLVEADEYDRAFLAMPCEVAVITNIDHDHPDIYPALDDMIEAFGQFAAQTLRSGTLIANWDDATVRELIKNFRGHGNHQIITYGVVHSGQWWATDLQPNEQGGYDFSVWRLGRQQGRFSLAVPGVHNVSNALGALAAADQLGVPPDQAQRSLARFNGAARRFEIRGEVNGVTVVDDYAHHPSEIKATLAAARQRFPNRPVWAVFQPHTYSRTAALFDDFARAFGKAHHVIVTDIFAARESDTRGMHSRDLVARMPHPDARYAADLDQAAALVRHEAQPGDVLVTLGAGDVWKVAEAVLGRPE